MGNLYVPYTGRKMAPVSINGHRLLFVFQNEEMNDAELETIGADRLKRVISKASDEANEKAIENLSRRSGAGIVIAPQDVEVTTLIKSLEDELPWLQ